MAFNEETIKKAQEAWLEHRRKLETDPEYKLKYEEGMKILRENLGLV